MPAEDSQIWLEGLERADYPRAALPAESDVLVIGGGITGVTAAYLAAKEGRKVVLLEKRRLGESATCRTTGFLTQVIDTDPIKLIRLVGRDELSDPRAHHPLQRHVEQAGQTCGLAGRRSCRLRPLAVRHSEI